MIRQKRAIKIKKLKEKKKLASKKLQRKRDAKRKKKMKEIKKTMRSNLFSILIERAVICGDNIPAQCLPSCNPP